MNMNERQRRVVAAIEMLEEVVLDVLKPTQEEQLQMDGTPVENLMDVKEIATRAGVPAPSETALVRYVLKQLVQAEKAEEIREGRTTVGWRISS